MKQLPADAIVITGVGMCSSLGNAALACAVARTGMSMSRELPDFLVRDEDGAEEAAFGDPVRGADGFQGMARLLCLAWPALEDLLEMSDIRALPPERTGLYLCLPDLASRRDEENSAPEPRAQRRSPGPSLCARLVQLGALALPKSEWNHLDEGQTGVVRAIAAASIKLRTGQWHRCLVGGVDSLLEPAALAWLLRTGRLKTPIKPDGLRPGEAGAFVLLERFDVARRRSAEILGVVAGAALTTDEPSAEHASHGQGAGLSEAVTRLLATADDAMLPMWLISDHNGEHRRAEELGNAIARLSQRFPRLVGGPRWFPAMSFGDTGAASAAVAIAMATRSFARGYAGGSSAMVVASSDGGDRAALRIDRPGVESNG